MDSWIYVLAEFSSLKLAISANEEERASCFPAAADATSSDFKLDSFSSSETLSLSERSSASRVSLSFSACKCLETLKPQITVEI